MRLPLVSPISLTMEQKTLYDRNRAEIAQGFSNFRSMNADGSLLGPWGIFIHMPGVGQAHEDLLDAITLLGHLPARAKQVAIIVVGAHFKAAYELYAHVAIAIKRACLPRKRQPLPQVSVPRILSPTRHARMTLRSRSYKEAFYLVQYMRQSLICLAKMH